MIETAGYSKWKFLDKNNKCYGQLIIRDDMIKFFEGDKDGNPKAPLTLRIDLTQEEKEEYKQITGIDIE